MKWSLPVFFSFFVAAELPELFHLSVSWYNYGSLVLFVIHLRWILYNVMACLRATDPTGILSGHLSSVSLCSSSSSSSSTSRGRGTSGWKGSHPELFKEQKQSQPHQNKSKWEQVKGCRHEGNEGRDFTEREWVKGVKRRTQTEGNSGRREMDGEDKGGREWEETITGAAERGHRRSERDGKLSCGCCRSQTGSPDDTSVGLTHPDSVISLLETCRKQQTTHWENTTHTADGLHDVSGQFSGLY